MDFEPFLRRCEAKFPKEECLEIIIKKIEEVFADDNFRHNSRACELFYITDKISKAQFFRMKKYVKELYDWLFELGKVTQEQREYVASLTMDDVISDEEIRSCYFSNLDGALDFVRAVGRRCGLDEEDDLLMIKSIVILSWHGLERSEMVKIKKSDLAVADKTVLFRNREPIVLPTEYFNILHRFAELDMHRGFPTGKRQVYEYSPYLMRASRSIQMDKDKVSQAVKRFNVVAIDQFGQRLSTKALQNNGAFCRMLESGEQDSRALTVAVKNIVGCDRHAAFWYKVMYEKWKNIFYPDGEVGDQ